MSFVVYDLAFMVLFTVAAVLFIYKRKHKLKRQGWIFLYHSTKGIEFMKSFSKKYGKILRPLQYVVVACGYILLAGIVWLIVVVAYRYIRFPEIVEIISAPPIAPLIPYFPTLFGVDAFFPPLYFTYFIVVLAVVAIVHEFSHGIFAKLNGIRIRSTGFAFFGPVLGAFVEQDEKQMKKAKKFPQLSILAAGTFSNIVFAAIFAIVAWLFFVASFTPAGINFNAYPSAIINTNSINSINGMPVENIDGVFEIIDDEEIVKIGAGDKEYLASGGALKKAVGEGFERVIVFEDAPAVNAGLKGPILEINDVRTTSREGLTQELSKYSPGDEITIKTIENDEAKYYNIILGERDNRAYLGIGLNYPTGLQGVYFNFISSSKNSGLIYYETKWGGDFAWFIYHLFWWLVLINFFVALFNMLPLGILDGGRFFYLTVWGITGSEKFGRKAFAFATWAIAGLFALMMIGWLIAIV